MSVKSLSTFRQGVHSFASFEEYYRQWLIPSTLGDLETIYKGATLQWNQNPEQARGNFALATTLLAAMDHVGSFLRKPGEPIHNALNISLCARLLKSTWDVHQIIAYAGRNTLIHETWPATMLVINEGRQVRRLGLNLSANNNTALDNRLLYLREYSEPLDGAQIARRVLKLRINVYSLLEDFSDLLRNWPIEVDAQTFREVQEHSGSLCHFAVAIDATANRDILKGRPKRYEYNRWRFGLLDETRYLFGIVGSPEHETVADDAYITMPEADSDFRVEALKSRGQRAVVRF